MPQITQQFGRVVIAIIIILTLFGVVFGNWYSIPNSSQKVNLFQAIGVQSVEISDDLDASKTDTASKYSEFYGKEPPMLNVNISECKVNETYAFNDMFSTDTNSSLIISQVDDLSHNNSNNYVITDTTITFKVAGLYRIRVIATSSSTNLKTSKDITISVNTTTF